MAKPIDLTGCTFTRLTVLKRLPNNKYGGTVWECICECGEKTESCGNGLRSGKIKSCGCLQKEKLSQIRFVDISGKKFNKLTVLYRVENKNNRTAYMCKCDCGKEKIIIAKGIVNGTIKSCGCYNLEKSKKSKYRRYNTYDLSGEYGIGYTSKGEEFYFDLEDYNKIKDYCWHIGTLGYVESCTVNKKVIKFHRFIFDVQNKLKEVDHINGKTNDNRRLNLRVVDKQKNQMNAGIRKDNTSGVKGVSWHKRKEKWQADINYKNKRYTLGSYVNLQDAIKIRELAELKLFGEYSRRYEELKEKYKDVDLENVKLDF